MDQNAFRELAGDTLAHYEAYFERFVTMPRRTRRLLADGRRITFYDMPSSRHQPRED